MEWRKKLTNFYNFLIGIACLIAILSLILEYGFYTFTLTYSFHQFQIIAAAIITFTLLFKLFSSPDRGKFFKANQGYYFLVILFLILYILIYFQWAPNFIINLINKFLRVSVDIFIVQLYLICFVLLLLGRINQLFNSIRGTFFRPLVLIPFTFALIIFIGTFSLLLPRARSLTSEPLSFIDALFTATSATCVTGLIVKNTGLYFSRLGQVIILCLFQVGGLGIMTFTTFFGLLLGRRLGIREQAFLSGALSLEVLTKVGRLVVYVLIFTLIIEGLGAAILFVNFIPHFGPIFHNFYLSVFHAVSAFCNAGFSLFTDSFAKFQGHLGINLVMTGLIIIGGVGFIVIFDLIKYLSMRFKKEKYSISLHSKIVLTVTLILILAGTFLILFSENNSLFKDVPWSKKILISYFQSVTARTAGFNTIPISNLMPATAFLIVFLMLIGASPGSTGGGIKTSTFGVIVATAKSWLSGSRTTIIYKRSIPTVVIRQAICILLLAIVWISICTFILLQTEKADFVDVLFEEVSAFGTVGLSRGLTSHLTDVGKLVIILTMFVGRLGPLMTALYLAEKGIGDKYKYPEDRVLIG